MKSNFSFLRFNTPTINHPILYNLQKQKALDLIQADNQDHQPVCDSFFYAKISLNLYLFICNHVFLLKPRVNSEWHCPLNTVDQSTSSKRYH